MSPWLFFGAALLLGDLAPALLLAARGDAGDAAGRVAAGRGGRRAAVLQRRQAGHVGDYVAWMLLGVAQLGALIALPAA